MQSTIKIIISGLDNAGKTSILTAFDKKYDFEKEVLELEPTKRIEYQRTQFLKNSIIFWDMGGQERYRNEYLSNLDAKRLYIITVNKIIFVYLLIGIISKLSF